MYDDITPYAHDPTADKENTTVITRRTSMPPLFKPRGSGLGSCIALKNKAKVNIAIIAKPIIAMNGVYIACPISTAKAAIRAF